MMVVMVEIYAAQFIADRRRALDAEVVGLQLGSLVVVVVMVMEVAMVPGGTMMLDIVDVVHFVDLVLHVVIVVVIVVFVGGRCCRRHLVLVLTFLVQSPVHVNQVSLVECDWLGH